MSQFAIYEVASGRYVQLCSASDDQSIRDILATGQEMHAVADGFNDAAFYFDGTGPVAMPPQPSSSDIFDYTTKTWTDPRTLQDLKDAKWAEIKAARSAAEFAPFTWDGSSFDANASAIQHISGAVQMALLAQLASQPFSIDWTLFDNTVRTLSGADMIAVGIAAGTHSGAVYDHARVLRDQIEAATTADAVAAVVW